MKRKTLNRKVMLGISTMVALIVIIALCSFFPFIIDPSVWGTKEFISDELIVMAITLVSIVCVTFIGEAQNAQNSESNIAKARVHFSQTIEVVRKMGINAFCQWVIKVLQPRDMQEEREKILRRNGIDDPKILLLEKQEILSLIDTPQRLRVGEKGEERYFKGLSKEQAREVLKAKYFHMKLVDPSYYLTYAKNAGEASLSRRSGKEGERKAKLLSWSAFSKALMSLVTSMIFGALILDLSQGNGSAQAWLKFASRMFALASSSFVGYLVGSQANDIDAEAIEDRCLAHTMFENDKEFKPADQQEEAREEYINRVRKENVLSIERKP